MKRVFILFVIIAFSLFLINCIQGKRKKTASSAKKENLKKDLNLKEVHSTADSIDYFGVYTGTLPDHDNQEIEVTITIAFDNSFEKHTLFLNKDGKTHEDKGKYHLNDTIFSFFFDDAHIEYYLLEKASIRLLSSQREVIKGASSEKYVLKKETIF